MDGYRKSLMATVAPGASELLVHPHPPRPGLGEPQRNKASLSHEIRLVKKAITQSRVPCSPRTDHGWTGLWKCLQALMESLWNVLGASFLPRRCPGRGGGGGWRGCLLQAPYRHRLTSSQRPGRASHEPDPISLSKADTGRAPDDTHVNSSPLLPATLRSHPAIIV